jgi:hypothetical protein
MRSIIVFYCASRCWYQLGLVVQCASQGVSCIHLQGYVAMFAAAVAPYWLFTLTIGVGDDSLS